MAAVHAQRDVTATARGSSADSYISMTAEQMRRWGADVSSPADGVWHVRAGTGYVARTETVEYDASAAAHLFALAAASGGSMTVPNAAASASQPDAGITSVLQSMGCEVESADGAVSVRGPQHLRPIDIDLSAMPDQLPTVAVLATLADGTSSISGAAVTRGHEADRIAAVAAELTKLGVDVQERPDGLLIRGGTAAGPARLKTYDDHRLAMAFAALSLRIPGVEIDDPGCVAKTYPAFWDDLAAAGAVLREAS
jgi:3-phosphoshikimate 1-carboxyvinyltransferase